MRGKETTIITIIKKNIFPYQIKKTKLNKEKKKNLKLIMVLYTVDSYHHYFSYIHNKNKVKNNFMQNNSRKHKISRINLTRSI